MPSEFKLKRRVVFSETDMAGMCHFSILFRYMEDTEHAFLRSLGLSVHAVKPEGIVSFPRVSAQCDFQHPLRFEDEVEIHLRVTEKRVKSIVYDFTFHKTTGPSPVEVAHGSMAVVCARKASPQDRFRAIEIPKEIAAKIESSHLVPRDD